MHRDLEVRSDPPICVASDEWQSRLKSAQSWPIWDLPQLTANAWAW